MTRRMTALLLTALMLALSGCGSLLDRDYRSVSRHISHTSDTEDTSALRAETYSGLVNDVQFFVSMGIRSLTELNAPLMIHGNNKYIVKI